MPFTFAHPAIILPIYKKASWLSLTGLVCGSIAPDFEYFIRMDATRVYTHTWLSIFYIDTILALAIAFIYHNIVRDRLVENLPSSLRERLAPYSSFRWNTYFMRHTMIVVTSACIGCLLHLFWDGFTHEQGWFVELVPVMCRHVKFANSYFPLFLLLQWLSSMAGLVIIGYTGKQMPRVKASVSQPYIILYWTIVLCLSTLTFIFGMWNREFDIVNVVINFISSGIVGIVAAPLVIAQLEKY